MELIRSVLLLLFGCSVVSAPVHRQRPRNVEARPGSAVTLWSSTSTKTNTDLCDGVVTLEVTYKGVEGVVTAALVREGEDDVHSRHEKFKGPVLLEGLCSGNVSVKLINVTTNCSGIYTFSVNTGGEPTHSPINLTVREQPDVKPANIKQLNQQGDNGTLGSDKQGSDHIAPIGNGTIIGSIAFIVIVIVVIAIGRFVIWPRYKKKASEIPATGEEMAELRGTEEPDAADECEEGASSRRCSLTRLPKLSSILERLRKYDCYQTPAEGAV